METMYECFDCKKVLGREGITRIHDKDDVFRDEIVKDPWHYVCGKCGGRIMLLVLS